MHQSRILPTIHFSNDDAVIRVTFVGQVTGDGLVEVKKRIAQGEDSPFANAIMLVSDFCEATTVQLCAHDIERDVRMSHRAARVNPRLTVIGILPQALMYGFSRMWQALAEYPDPLPWQSHLVHTRAEAEIYIGEVLEALSDQQQPA